MSNRDRVNLGQDATPQQPEVQGNGAGDQMFEHRVAFSFVMSLMGLMIVAVPLLVHGVAMFIGVYAVMFVAAKAVLGREERRHSPLRERGDGIDPPFFELRLSVTVIGCLTLSTLVGVSPDSYGEAVYLGWPLTLGLFCGAADGMVARSLPYGALPGVIWRGITGRGPKAQPWAGADDQP